LGGKGSVAGRGDRRAGGRHQGGFVATWWPRRRIRFTPRCTSNGPSPRWFPGAGAGSTMKAAVPWLGRSSTGKVFGL